MDFDTFIDQAWTDHAEHTEAVAARLATAGPGLLQQPEQVAALAQLAQHVHGQHLGRWAEGLAFQERLAALPLVQAGSATALALQRHRAVLRLAAGLADDRAALDHSEAARLGALAAAALNAHDTARAAALLEAAVAATEAGALPDTDPAVRALAVAGNNLASALEDLPTRGEPERALMLRAAHLGRQYWARAGTWLETQRAEYRLAKSWLKAGEPGTALQHAQRGLDLIDQQAPPATPAAALALERFFGFEARALAAHALRHAELLAESQACAETAFQALPASDQAWCQATRDQVTALRG